MSKVILCCGILQKEIEHLLQGREVELRYIDPGLHTNLDLLEVEVVRALGELNADQIPLILGTQCHPELEELAAGHGGRLIKAKNCIEMLLGEKMTELDAAGNSFYLTGGWLENWVKIFRDGLKWDEIDARQNFYIYDRILLLDTGIIPLDDEKMLEFFEYTQTMVEIMAVDLDHLRLVVNQLLEEVD